MRISPLRGSTRPGAAAIQPDGGVGWPAGGVDALAVLVVTDVGEADGGDEDGRSLVFRLCAFGSRVRSATRWPLSDVSDLLGERIADDKP